MPGKIYIIATPIGNLKDITYRAVETLQIVDLVLCEDTRMAAKLLGNYGIKKPLLSYHQRSKLSKTEKIIEHLKNGSNLALVTDAGTPGISDPGNELVEKIIQYFEDDIEIIPIPGPSALSALIQVVGINMKEFVFLGFPPHKKGREKFFKKIDSFEIPVVYYESPYRLIRNLELLDELTKGNKKIIIGRELTKIYEEIKRGGIKEIVEYYKANSDKTRGEFVVVVH
jgi:16S rRNA (cytidine1402-2'-O)-methyltransferase